MSSLCAPRGSACAAPNPVCRPLSVGVMADRLPVDSRAQWRGVWKGSAWLRPASIPPSPISTSRLWTLGWPSAEVSRFRPRAAPGRDSTRSIRSDSPRRTTTKIDLVEPVAEARRGAPKVDWTELVPVTKDGVGPASVGSAIPCRPTAGRSSSRPSAAGSRPRIRVHRRWATRRAPTFDGLYRASQEGLN